MVNEVRFGTGQPSMQGMLTQKQHKLPFPNKGTINKGIVDVIHVGTGSERKYFTRRDITLTQNQKSAS